MNTNRTIPEQSIETRMLIDSFGKLDYEQVLTKEDVKKMTGVAVEFLKGKIRTARIRVLADLGIRIQAVPGVGWKRATEAGKVNELEENRDRIGRAAHRAKKIAASTDTSKLGTADVMKFNVVTSQLFVLEHLTKTAATKRIATAVQNTQAQIPLGKVLEAITG